MTIPISVETPVFTYKILQQPADMPTMIWLTRNTVTQYRYAAEHGCIGLLAHSWMAGKLFPLLTIGQSVEIASDDGAVREFTACQIRRFKALDPYNPYSQFIDLDSGGEMSSTDVFMAVYSGDQVTFETCLTLDNNPVSGRLFVIAK